MIKKNRQYINPFNTCLSAGGFLRQTLVMLYCLASIKVFGQSETQNPNFPFWKIKGNQNIDTATQ